MASRYGANIVKLEKPWGEVFRRRGRGGVGEHKPDTLCRPRGDADGARQPMANLGEMCRDHDCLLMADTVTSIGGLPVKLDEWGVDACYAGGQKALSCPPGISPLTFGDRALRKMDERQARGEVTANWYLDMNMIKQYLVATTSACPAYHHTAPISMAYAPRGADDPRGGGARGVVGAAPRVGRIPEGVDGGKVVTFLRENYNIEIAGGLGQLAGKVWRIGLMGYNSREGERWRSSARRPHAPTPGLLPRAGPPTRRAHSHLPRSA
ncbi:serine-pyruvate transaminase [Aureococcus anophagefferens]|nr:serine-pyruvate transaminase [Aureococcus anophagefferens]